MSSGGELLDCEELFQSFIFRISVPVLGVGFGEGANSGLGFRRQDQAFLDSFSEKVFEVVPKLDLPYPLRGCTALEEERLQRKFD